MNPHLNTKTCGCGVTFFGGSTAKYCPTCRAERIRQRNKAYKARRNTRSLGSTDLCAICGKEYTVNSGPQKYCSECAVKEDKRRKRESWLREYYGNPEKRRQIVERARQWALKNRVRVVEILRKSYEKTKDARNENRRKRTGYKLRPLGRTEICPKCQQQFTVTGRNQKYCINCKPS